MTKQDKGYSQEIAQFLKSVKEGKPVPINFDDIYLSTLATFKVHESIIDNNTVIFD